VPAIGGTLRATAFRTTRSLGTRVPRRCQMPRQVLLGQNAIYHGSRREHTRGPNSNSNRNSGHRPSANGTAANPLWVRMVDRLIAPLQRDLGKA